MWFNVAMTSYRLSFPSVEIDKIYSLTLPGEKVCVAGGHVTSRNQGLYPNDKGDRGERPWERICSHVELCVGLCIPPY